MKEFIKRMLGIQSQSLTFKLNDDMRKLLWGEYENTLLVIKLKDMYSVPEVYYQGKRIDGGLVDVQYHYHTTGDEVNGGLGLSDMSLEWYKQADDGRRGLVLDTVKHERRI